jgi:hypothetical protein
MTIKERGTIPEYDLPPARLYLDDIEEIVAIFRDVRSYFVEDNEHAVCTTKFAVGRFECTEIEELKSFGERTSTLEIEVRRGGTLIGALEIGVNGTSWKAYPRTLAETFQIYGRLHALFEVRKIRWKTALRAVPPWMIFVFFVVAMPTPNISGLSAMYHSHRIATVWTLAVGTAMLMILNVWFVYRLMWKPTIVEFRRVHDPQGFRKQFGEWKPYILAAVIGGGITKAFDLIVYWIKK